ncbi:hypothetical protein GCM10009119_07620 [Algoriphagus jejuensis]|uniref:Uncharacterized protein n=1 Tax=Algoriphagus jejuensis TaxID=419934 RepID=A0ABP3YC64_9BACT
MKITKEQFEEMKAKYDKEIKKGKPAKGPKRDVENQTNWESYSKEDLMEVLNQDGVIGLKFHLTEYTKEVAEEFHGADAEQYIGRINLVYSPVYASSGIDRSGRVQGSEEYYDRGQTCPPYCE